MHVWGTKLATMICRTPSIRIRSTLSAITSTTVAVSAATFCCQKKFQNITAVIQMKYPDSIRNCIFTGAVAFRPPLTSFSNASTCPARVWNPSAYVTPAPPTPKLTPPLFVLLASKCSHGVGVGTSKSVAAARSNNIIQKCEEGE